MYVLFHRGVVCLARNNTVLCSFCFLAAKATLARAEMVSVTERSSPQSLAIVGQSNHSRGLVGLCCGVSGVSGGGDCTDRRGEEQHEKGKVLLLMFLSAKWSSKQVFQPS